MFNKSTTLPFTLSVPALALAISVGAETSDIKSRPDGSFVTLSGTVVSQEKDSLMLDYGDGTIRVELDDSDNFDRKKLNLEGDKVTVYGEIDDNFYHARSLEADSVYVSDLNTLISDPSPEDEESADLVSFSYYSVPVDYDFYISGTVTSVSENSFTVDTGKRKTTVDVSELGYNPLDDLGFQKIKEGDLVSVSGNLDGDLFSSQELVAETIVSLS